MGGFGGSTWGSGPSTTNAGAFSISDILYHALRKARVTNGPGRIPSVDQISDTFYLFKALLQAWRAQKLTRLNVSRNLKTLVSGTATYSIGPSSADFATNTRPSKIEYAGLVDMTSGSERSIEIYTAQRWSEVQLKNISSLPLGLFYERTIPNGRITCCPIPSQADSLALYLWDTEADPEASTGLMDLSDGFLRALIDNLALDCVETFGTSNQFDAKAFDRLERSARDSKASIESINNPPPPRMCSDAPGGRGGGWFDYKTGLFR